MTHPFAILRRKWWVLAVGVLLVGAGVLVWHEATHSDPVSPDEALHDYRDERGVPTHGGPRPGVYRMSVTGREDGGLGPVRAPRTLPRQGTVTVTGTDDGWEVLTTYSRQHIEAARYVAKGPQIAMTWRRVDVTFVGIGRDDRRDIDGTARLLTEENPEPGTTWTDRYLTGSLVNEVTNRVLRRENLSIGGESVATVVVRSRTTTTGALSGTRDETFWWSPAHRLVVRSSLAVDIGGVVGYRSHIDSRLDDLTPVT